MKMQLTPSILLNVPLKSRKMKIRILSILLLIICFFPTMSADRIDSASVAYKEGRFAEAIELYNRVVESDGVSAALMANMGNAYAKAGDYGKAMLCYERSLRLDPSDGNVRNNRAYIVSKIEDGNKANAKGKNLSVVPDEPTFFTNIKDYITHSHSSDTWAIWGAICFLLVLVCLAMYLFRSEIIVRKIGFFGSMVLVGLCIIFICFSFASARACTSHDEGVITGYKVILLSEPFTTAKPSSSPLVRGTKVDILERETNQGDKVEWYKVRLNSDYAGWIQSTDLEEI